jgi:hypothetical protein
VPRSWIEQTLEQIARERRGQMKPQPTGPIGQPTGGGLGAAVIGPNPPPAQPQGFGFHPLNRMHAERQARDVSSGPERLNPLIAAYQAYLKRSGRSQDPLLDRTRSRQTARGTMVDEMSPAKQVMGPGGEAFSVNRSNNERRGLTMQTFELPGGKRVHVYFGKNGERTVIRLPKRA